jgi:hypothetical protein
MVVQTRTVRRMGNGSRVLEMLGHLIVPDIGAVLNPELVCPF